MGKSSFDRAPGLCCFKEPCLWNSFSNIDKAPLQHPGDARAGGMLMFGSLKANDPL